MNYWKNKKFLISAGVGVLLLVFSLFVNFYAGIYATERASSPVTDLVLNNIPVFDVDGIFVYGPMIMWIFVAALCLKKPQRIPFILKSVALFVLVRSVFITLTHIGPFPDQASVQNLPNIVNKFTMGGDLFFSAHTGLPFLLALAFWDDIYLRIFFIVSAVFFGAIVLMAHMHYSIDVLSAFFITFAIFHIAETVFAKEKELFVRGLEN